VRSNLFEEHDVNLSLKGEVVIHLPSNERGMKKGFTLIELMVAIASTAVVIALLLPDIQKTQDAALKGTQKAGPYWVYREYEYAGGPLISETSGSYQHSLQEILDMYVINLKKDQLKNSLELQADARPESNSPENSINSGVSLPTSSSSAPDLVVNPSAEINCPIATPSNEELIRNTKECIKNFKVDLSNNRATLVARRNSYATLKELQEDLRKLESQP